MEENRCWYGSIKRNTSKIRHLGASKEIYEHIHKEWDLGYPSGEATRAGNVPLPKHISYYVLY